MKKITKDKDFNFYMGGEFDSVYIAHSNKGQERLKGASGGVISSIARYLLDKSVIDGFVCVGSGDSKPWKRRVFVVKNKESLKRCRGSIYQKIRFPEIASKVNGLNSAAAVAPPCVTKTFRKAKNRGEFRNLDVIISHFCGWGAMSQEATRRFIVESSIPMAEVNDIDYRGGGYPGGFTVTGKNGCTHSFPKSYYDFMNIMYLDEACLNCQFYMGEGGDISVGDAWIEGKQNWSTVITRTKQGEEILTKAIKNDYLTAQSISPRKVVNYHWHNLREKKTRTLLMRLAIKILRNKFVRNGVPFRVLGMISRARRKVLKFIKEVF